MNSLSWMIYLISLAGNLSVAFGFLIGGTVFYLVIRFLYSIWEFDEVVDKTYIFQKLASYKRVLFVWVPVLVFLIISEAAIPDRRSMVLIAASEVGERVMTQTKLAEAIDPSVTLLKTWIEKETIGLKKEIERAKKGTNDN